MRMPAARATALISACAWAPAGEDSAKPEVMITATPTPMAAHSLTAAGVASAGTRSAATSTGSGTLASAG